MWFHGRTQSIGQGMYKKLIAVLLLSSLALCGQKKKKNSYIDESLFSGFIEADFPFINSALDLGKSPAGFPPHNYTARGVFLKLNDGVWACFDRDLLRVSAIWSGGDFELNTMSQISYPGTGKKSSSFPKIKGNLLFANGLYSGLSQNNKFTDPRNSRLGEMPNAKWLGIHLSGNETILKYSFNNQLIHERILEVGKGVFSRTFSSANSTQTLSIALFQKHGLKGLSSKNGIYEIQDGKTKLALSVQGGQIELGANGLVSLKIKSKNAEVRFSNSPDSLKRFLSTKTKPIKLSSSKKRWPQVLTSKAHIGKNDAAYTVDKIELPFKNPWRRSLRIAALDFFKSGRAAAVTFDGDVWLIDGLKGNLNSVKWKRFASGIYSPLSLKIHNEKIFVFGRDQITRLHDSNSDDEADFYENYSTAFLQAMNTRDFAMDMVIDEDENIYLAKGGIQNMGGKLSNKDFYHSTHAGSVIRVFNKGKSAEVFADGFREPFLGYNPQTKTLYATDQQGHYVPATPIMKVEKGGYYGHEPSNYRKSKKTVEPVVWIPHRIDNSAAGMTFVNSTKMGALNQKMTLQSYGQMASFVLHEGDGFSGVSRIPGTATFALLKGAVNPVDEQLYVAGFKIYSHSSPDLGGIARLRYTGKKVNFPVDFKVFKEGIELSFDGAVNKSDLEKIANYQVQRWNYQRTSKYGSGHFKMDSSPGEESLGVAQAIAGSENKVFLIIPGMKAVEQMSVNYNLPGKISSVYFSISKLNSLERNHYAYKSTSGLDLSKVLVQSKKNLKKSAKLGESLLTKYSCIACHSTDGSKLGKIGPTFKGLYGSKKSFVKASPIKADDKYIRESLLEPNKKIVKGFQVAMGSYKGILNDVEIDSIILYLKTLK